MSNNDAMYTFYEYASVSGEHSWSKHIPNCLHHYNSERVAGVSWPSVEYLTSPPISSFVARAEIEVEGKDQGWGNTGHSHILLQTVSADGIVLASERLVTLTHQRLTTKKEIFPRITNTQFVSAPASGSDEEDATSADEQQAVNIVTAANNNRNSKIRIVSVSAPWSGYQSYVWKGKITLTMHAQQRCTMVLIRYALQMRQRQEGAIHTASTRTAGSSYTSSCTSSKISSKISNKTSSKTSSKTSDTGVEPVLPAVPVPVPVAVPVDLAAAAAAGGGGGAVSSSPDDIVERLAKRPEQKALEFLFLVADDLVFSIINRFVY